MKFKAILFDMDGTLVPMDTQTFTKGYFKFLYAKLAKYGIDPSTFGKNMWAGVASMVKNDGAVSNEDRFWETFQQVTGLEKDTVNGDCLDFYGNEFHQAKQFTQENPLAAELVHTAREKAPIVILATNPLFPMVGQHTRMGWVGLKPEDFDLITAYETECFCKPNPRYYTSILERFSLKPEDCLMIGNDEYEDMFAATQAGIQSWLITDWAIFDPQHPWQGAKGTSAEALEMLKSLERFE